MILAFIGLAGCSLVVGSGPRQHDADIDVVDAVETMIYDDGGEGGEEIPSVVCGDGILAPNEMCDDGDTVDDRSCSADCSTTPVFQVNVVRPGAQYDPSIAGAAGSYVVAWSCTGSPEAGENSLHVRARRFGLGGQGIGTDPFDENADFRFNTITDQSQYKPSVAIGQRRFMSVWIDTSPSTGYPAGDVVWRITGFDNATSPAEQTLNVESQAGTQDWGRVAGNGGAKFLAAWISQDVVPRHAACKVYNATTESWSSEYSCSATASDDEIQVDTAMSSLGWAAAVWTRQGDIFMQLFAAASGEREGEEKHVDVSGDGTCDYPSAAFDGFGRLLVVWRYQPPVGNIEIRGRIYDPAGEPLSESDFTINTTPLTGGATTGTNPNYVPDAAGDTEEDIFIAVWDAPGQGGGRGRIVLAPDSFGIHRMDREAFGQDFTFTNDFGVTRTEYAGADQFVVACAGPGSCMVVWTDQSGVDDTDSYGIRGRLITIAQP